MVLVQVCHSTFAPSIRCVTWVGSPMNVSEPTSLSLDLRTPVALFPKAKTWLMQRGDCVGDGEMFSVDADRRRRGHMHGVERTRAGQQGESGAPMTRRRCEM